MARRLMTVMCALAACMPTLVVGQQRTANRAGGWEFGLGAGYLFVDSSLRAFLGNGAPESRFADSATPNSYTPLVAVRIGYAFNTRFGLSVSGEAARGDGLTYYTPTAAITYDMNLNGNTSPFLSIGTELTRIEGDNERVTHSTWGALAGVGIRQMLGESRALRLEGRVRFEGYDEVSMAEHTVYNPTVTLGFSCFVGGRKDATIAGAAVRPACPPPGCVEDTHLIRRSSLWGIPVPIRPD